VFKSIDDELNDLFDRIDRKKSKKTEEELQPAEECATDK
jgi:hypothetical protein